MSNRSRVLPARRAIFVGGVSVAIAIGGTLGVAGPAAASGSSSPAWLRSAHPGIYFPQLGVTRSNADVFATSSSDLAYGGAVDGIGVTTGSERVYVVFWGSQWGSTSTDGSGYLHLSHDTAALAPRLQAMFAGIGTNNEMWSGVMTQYCQGVSRGAQTCPSTASHVAYPTGGALAGVWADEGSLAPGQASGHQIAGEAVKAAGHFGRTSASANRDAQYVVVSPSGANPDDYVNQGFCAYHDWNGDTTLSGGAASSPYGDIAFTNLPYIPDAGRSCGAGYVNGSSGNLDGVTIVAGHEYSETITDQNPAGGWTDSTGEENADKCAWTGVGGTGGAQNVSFATGSFPMQGTWSNDSVNCRISHSIVGAAHNTVTVTNPGTRTTGVGMATKLTMHATDSGSSTLSYKASGLPSGLTISSSSGVISGTPSAIGGSSVTVTATDGTGANGSTTFTWNVLETTIANSTFSTGDLRGWWKNGTATVTASGGHGGTDAAIVGSSKATNGDSSLGQAFIAGSSASTLKVYYDITCPDSVSHDWATVSLRDHTAHQTITVLANTCTKGMGWKSASATVVPGHWYSLSLINHDDDLASNPTSTMYDDITLS